MRRSDAKRLDERSAKTRVEWAAVARAASRAAVWLASGAPQLTINRCAPTVNSKASVPA